jgi:aryl-alcohol dehydrogenase (NADP+)
MARGFFAGNRKRGGGGETIRAQSDPFANDMYFHEQDFTVADRAAEVAKGHNATASQIALAWVLSKPYIAAPIIGSSKIEHLDQAIAALEIKLSDDEVRRLEELYQPHPILGHS